MKQSRLMSLVEVITNVVVGYGVAVLTQLVVFPWFGLPTRVDDALAIGAVFTAVSIVRGLALRRPVRALAPSPMSCWPAPIGAASIGRRSEGTSMPDSRTISDHWATGDVFSRILEAMAASSITAEDLTVEKLAPIDHFHARGFAATQELADILPIKAGDRIIDIGCGIGGPARYLAERFGCSVDGIDITGPFVEAANKLSALVGLQERVRIELGDGQRLPYNDETFDGGYTLHVTMNVPDRGRFFGEACRVLKPGAFFALTEHGLGPAGDPHHPVPWSDDGSGAYLMRPSDTVGCLERAGFVSVEVTDTGRDYLEGYRRVMELAGKGELPAFGTHVLLGQNAPDKIRNAARNIEEGRTHPIRVICCKRV